jgi:GTP-binding protein
VQPRSTGALVSSRSGRATAHAIEHLQSRGTMFVGPGDLVYRGMIVGENSRASDVEVDVTKERKGDDAPPGEPGPTVRLIPPRSMSLEQALEFLRDDEAVEVTPVALRLRKRDLEGGVSASPDANP